MSHTFCTLFYSNYLFKGLALYQSLIDSYSDFTLWILCMDGESHSLLDKMGLDNVELIRYADFENDDLRRVKPERSVAEFCWTCTPPLCEYVMARNPQAPHITYLDADVMFFRDPGPLYDELGEGSVLIVPHRHAPQYKGWEKTAGIYNVSVVIFRNDPYGTECLRWWSERCLEACRLDPEEGLCGDQKYLDDWPSRFRNVTVLHNLGGGLAPWNITSYQLAQRNGSVYVDSDELIFYHFHQLKLGERPILTKRPIVAATGYSFSAQHRSLVYSPYLKQLRRAMNRVRKVAPSFADGYSKLSLRDFARAYRRGNLMFA